MDGDRHLLTHFLQEFDSMSTPTLAPVYEYYAIDIEGWRFHYSTSPDVHDHWMRNGIQFFAFGSEQEEALPVFQYHREFPWRFRYSSSSFVGQEWINNGVAFYAFSTPKPMTIPVYQYCAFSPERYHYSIHPNLGQGWSNDGVIFYVYAAKPDKTIRG
jgi:hypothetical protein